MVGVDAAVRIRLERAPVLGGRKESVVRIEHFLRQNGKELAGQAPGVDAFLVTERHVQAPPHLLSVAQPELVVGILEHVLAPDVEAQAAMTTRRLLSKTAHLRFEPLPFHVKVQEGATPGNLNKRT